MSSIGITFTRARVTGISTIILSLYTFPQFFTIGVGAEGLKFYIFDDVIICNNFSRQNKAKIKKRASEMKNW